MKKKFFGCILTGLMALSVFPMTVGAADADRPHIQIGEAVYANDGKSVEIPVTVVKNPGFVSATIPVSWDGDQLTLERIEKTDLIENGLLKKNVEYQVDKNSGWIGYNINDVVSESGIYTYHLAWNYDTMYTGNYQELEFTEPGTLCVLVFKVKETIPEGGKFDITVNAQNAFTSVMSWDMSDLTKTAETHLNSTGVTITFGDGGVKGVQQEDEPTYLLGDIDLSGKVNSDDAIYLLMYSMLGEDFYPIKYKGNIDFVVDSKINSDDAIYLLMYSMLGEDFYPIN